MITDKDSIESMKVSQPAERTYTQEEVDFIEKRAYTHGVCNTTKFKSIDDLYALFKKFFPLNP